jgi:hypothetical protein
MDERETPAPLAAMPLAILALLAAACLGVLASPRALEVVFDVFEALVAFGR